MEGNRRNFLNRHSNPHFKKTARPRKENQYNSNREEFPENFHSSETVYQILCQSKKIGSVIGKGGNIVKALREDTQAKITVSDSVPGSDERVIIISSPSDKRPNRRSSYNGRRDEREYEVLDPHCAAQDALLKVHDKIVDEDLIGADRNTGSETVVSARLLVSNNMVGCLLGRKGDVIQRLRSETGANVRVLPADHLPTCATGDHELVQVSGKAAIVKKALYEVSTLLHQNPRKDDKPPLSHPIPYASQECHFSSPAMRIMPFEGRYGGHPSSLVHEELDSVAPHIREAPTEFAIKILCSAERIGGVIGRGGSNIRQLEQETRASVHVENVSKESDERVIRVSSFEALWDRRSPTIDAILHLQNKTSEYSADGTITTRLLIPSNKVGCILGQGGRVISDMRRRTHADIRVFTKEEKPKCASEDEELVQISGSFRIAKDALEEITSRLRTRYFRDANTSMESASDMPLPRFCPPENLRSDGLSLSRATVVGSSGRYGHIEESVREFDSPSYALPPRAKFDSPSYALPPRATSYLDFSEANISSVSATAGSRISEFAGTRLRHEDPYSTGPVVGNCSRYIYERASSSAGPNQYPPSGGYRGYESEHGMPYRDTYAQQDPYENIRGNGSYNY